jgi:hypothetical protein
MPLIHLWLAEQGWAKPPVEAHRLRVDLAVQSGGSTTSRDCASVRDERSPMTSTSEPVHLNHHHRDTLSQIFTHPLSHNIEWRAVLSLLEAVGAVETRPDGKFVLTLGPETETLERPRDKDLDPQQVVDLRRMLRNAGYGPETERPAD